MSLWSTMKGLVLEDDDAPKGVDASSTAPPVVVQPVAQTSILQQSSHPSVATFKATGQVDPAFLEALSKEVDEDTSPKLLQFLQLLASLAPVIADERTRFQAAMVSAAQQGLEMSHLIQAAQDRLTLVDRETQEFETDMKAREEQSIGQKQAQVDQIGQQIVDLQRQITELGNSQTQLQNAITGEKQKLTDARQRFSSARDALREKFSKELDLIRSNTKA